MPEGNPVVEGYSIRLLYVLVVTETVFRVVAELAYAKTTITGSNVANDNWLPRLDSVVLSINIDRPRTENGCESYASSTKYGEALRYVNEPEVK
jgi:hypothetical protein